MYFFVRKPTPKMLTVRMHPKGVTQAMRGRRGATVIIPAIGMQDKSELKEHIEMVNERNPGRERITEASLEEAVAKRMTDGDRPKSVAELQRMGLKPGQRVKKR